MDSFVPGNALEEQLLADGSLGLGTFAASEAVRRLRTQQRSDALDGRWKTPKLDSKESDTVRVGAAVVGSFNYNPEHRVFFYSSPQLSPAQLGNGKGRMRCA